jgi:phosphatidyl-myo-inositol dimannoside synthase
MFNVADELARQGERVVVFADVSHESGSEKFDKKQGFVICRFGGLKPFRRLRKAWALKKAIQKQAGVVICDTWKSLELLKKTHPQAKILCLAHGMEFPDGAKADKVKRVQHALSKAEYILANSRFTADRLSKFLPSDKTVDVFFPGISAPILPESSDRGSVERLIASRHPLLLTIGRLEPRKGQDKVIIALPQLLTTFPKLLYAVIGDGPDLPRLQELVDQLGLNDHVYFLGRTADSQKSAWIERANLFVMPSRCEGNSVEGFGLVYLEAAWFGVPSVAGKFGGASDAVVDGETGVLCDGDDAADVGKAIHLLLSDDALRKQMGTAAALRVKSMFMWPTVIQTLKNYF